MNREVAGVSAFDSVYLTLAEARAMIARGIAKAGELKQAGTIVVVDAGGNTVSISRMDDSPLAAVAVSRAKAYLAAVQGRPTANFAANVRERPEIFAAYQAILPRQPFPGPGGMPIMKQGRCVGGIATGAGIGPFTEVLGLDPGKLMADVKPANAEDLVISAALGAPYRNQHGDRAIRAPGDGTRPEGAVPLSLADALRYADRVIAKAHAVGVRVGVAVVDEMGRLIQSDRMDGAPLVSCEMAEAKALTAAKFQRPTSTLTEEFRAGSPRLQAVEKLAGFTILAMGGGVPILRDGRMIGAIGVSGSGAFRDREATGGDEDLAFAAIDEP
jgi:uncharacterized protein GlcG (DUF336 family)